MLAYVLHSKRIRQLKKIIKQIFFLIKFSIILWKKNIVFLQKQLKFVNILKGIFVIINIIGIFALKIKQNIWMNHF